MKKWKYPLLAIFIALCLTIFPFAGIATATEPVLVSIGAPDEVVEGSEFIANVNVFNMVDFDSCGFDVTYDESIITITDITDGEIDGHIIPVNEWHYIPVDTVDTGKIRVAIYMPGAPAPGVSGSGYIAQIHFYVLGSACSTSVIHLENVGMYNYLAEEIPTTTEDDLVHVYALLEVTDCSADPNPTEIEHDTVFSAVVTGGVESYTWDWDFGDGSPHSNLESPTYNYGSVGTYVATVTVTDSLGNFDDCSFEMTVYMVGDANGDGKVDTGDITKVKRIYFGSDEPTLGADANGDGKVDMGDITAIKAIYFGNVG